MKEKIRSLDKLALESGMQIQTALAVRKEDRRRFDHTVLPLGRVTIRESEEVEKLVKWARQEHIPLLPFSSGGEHGGHGSRARTPVAMVDMSHLDRVIRVDRRNHAVLFESGVSFAALAAACARQGMRPMLPLLPRPGKSALASYLEREPTTMPVWQWDMSDPLLCMDVVFGTGEHFRTGSAAGPGDLKEQWAAGMAQKNPMGPGQSDLMRVVQGAQGTIGIVRWISAKCEPKPDKETLHMLTSDHLHAVQRLTYFLMRRKHPELCFLLDRNSIREMAARYGLAEPARLKKWALVYSLADARYLASEKRQYVGAEIQREAALHNLLEVLREDTDGAWLNLFVSPPAAGRSWKSKDGVAALDMQCQSTLDKSQGFVEIAHRIAGQHGVQERQICCYLQPQVGGRVCHIEVNIMGLASGKEALAAEIAEQWAGTGGFFSRPYGREITEVTLQHASAASLIPRIKKLFDPDGILAPDNLKAGVPKEKNHAA